MDSGELDFYQHSKVCSNTCRSTKIDLVGAKMSSDPSNELVSASPSVSGRFQRLCDHFYVIKTVFCTQTQRTNTTFKQFKLIVERETYKEMDKVTTCIKIK